MAQISPVCLLLSRAMHTCLALGLSLLGPPGRVSGAACLGPVPWRCCCLGHAH
jgi:hypothetical protein|eukprot:COSAG01_NODE_5112_length_4474_cov_395.839771_4_plen_53_part_00